MMDSMESPNVFVVILNKDGKDCLQDCLKAVFALTYGNLEVIVVDNASRDGSIEHARRTFPKSHFILNRENLGFARGMNVGIRYACAKGARYVWLLNNDAVPRRDSLSELVRTADPDGRDILSPFILDRTGKTWFAAGQIDWMRMRAVHVDPPVDMKRNEPYTTGYLSGCALLLPKPAIDTIGLFDEAYFLYYEDADYSLRAKKAGFRLRVVPGSVVVHGEHSIENPDKTYWLVRSGLRFFRTHTPRWRKPYLGTYLLLRKLKNRIDIIRGSAEALLVKRAYADDSEERKFA